jgi:hypothetical protein
MNPAGSSLLVRDLIEDDVVDITPQALMERLEATAVAFSKVADEIGRLMILLEGHETAGGEFVTGLDTRWADHLHRHYEQIVEEHEQAERKLPTRDRLERLAERRARDADPILWQEWRIANSRIAALKEWVRIKDKANSARQSVLKGERQ